MPGTPPQLGVMAATTPAREVPWLESPPSPCLSPWSPCQKPHLSTELGKAVNTCCNIHTIFCSPRQEDGWTPVPQRNPANQPASHRHSVRPGKAFIHSRRDRLPFLVMSGGVVSDKGLCPRQPGRLQRAGASACARDEKQSPSPAEPLWGPPAAGKLRLCRVHLVLAPVGKMYVRGRERKCR